MYARRESNDYGNCGTEVANADQCIWSDWGECRCRRVYTRRVEERACGADIGECIPGVETRTCDAACNWNEFGPCRDQQGPAEEICGNGLDEDCDGEDETRPDAYEGENRNDTCNTCTYLNMMNDGQWDPDVNVDIRATIDNRFDSDYYCVVADDGLNVPGFWEDFEIQLTNIPAGADYDVWLYRSIGDCNDGNALRSGIEPGNRDEDIEWNEDAIGNDSGVYVIRVEGIGPSQSCFQEYLLSVDGLR